MTPVATLQDLSTRAAAEAVDAYRRGTALFLSGWSDRSEAELARAVRIDPRFSLAHLALTFNLLQNGRPLAAGRHLREVRRTIGHATPAERSHIRARLALLASPEHHGPAFRHLREHPNDAPVLSQVVSALHLVPRTVERHAALVELLDDRVSDDPQALAPYALSLCEAGRHADAERAVDRARATPGGGADVVHATAHVLQELRRPDEAHRVLREGLVGYEGAYAPHLSWHLFGLALELGERDEAEAWARRVLEASRMDGSPHGVVDLGDMLWRARLHGVSLPRAWIEEAAERSREMAERGTGPLSARARRWLAPRLSDIGRDPADGLVRRVAMAVACDVASRPFPLALSSSALALAAAGDAEGLKRLAGLDGGEDVREDARGSASVSALAEGLAAFVSGDYAGAVERLQGQAADGFQDAGGTALQRALYRRTLAMARRAAGEAGGSDGDPLRRRPPPGEILRTRWPGLQALPRCRLADLPTPVVRLDRVSTAVGAEVWCKRDDRTSPEVGGNKVRKLELLLGAASAEGADVVITAGPVGSHHALSTALLARQVGLATEVAFVRQPWAPHVESYLRAAAALGVRGRPAPEAILPAFLQGMALRCRLQGRRPYVIPPGGSNALGTVGYVEAGLELAAQIEGGEVPLPASIHVSLGSGGTAAGLAVGLAAARVRTELVAVCATPHEAAHRVTLEALVEDTVELLRQTDPAFPDVTSAALDLVVVDAAEAGAGYALPTESARAAAEMAALDSLRLEGTYTAKAFAALLRDAAAKPAAGPRLYWHTLMGVEVEPRLRGAPPAPPRLLALAEEEP